MQNFKNQPVKNQDRTIRAEMRLCYYVLTGKRQEAIRR